MERERISDEESYESEESEDEYENDTVDQQQENRWMLPGSDISIIDDTQN